MLTELFDRARPLLALTLCLCVLGGSGASVANEADKTANRISALQRSIQVIKEKLDTFTGKREALQRELREAEEHLYSRVASARSAREQLQSEQKKREALQSQHSKLEFQRDSEAEAIQAALRDAYKQGRQNRLKLILNQQDPAEVERLLKYYDFINAARNEKLQAYLDTLDEIDTSQQELLQSEQRIGERLAGLEQEVAAMKEARGERKIALERLNSKISSASERLEIEQTERSKLEALLEEMEAQIAAFAPTQQGMPFAKRKGKMRWPVSGQRQNRFGARKPQTDLRWEGLMITAREGDPVRAIHGGRVIFADWMATMGQMVLIEHGDRYMTLYAHNSAIMKNVGETVTAGEIIALSGDSGGQRGTGTYFEVRHKGKPLNPAKWCR